MRNNYLKNAENIRQLQLFTDFGTGDKQLNLNFTWIDSMTEHPCTNSSALFEITSCTYNAAVASYYIGTTLHKSVENASEKSDKCLEAFDELCKAANLFQKASNNAMLLPYTVCTSDMSHYVLKMWVNTSKALAQSSIYTFITDPPS